MIATNALVWRLECQGENHRLVREGKALRACDHPGVTHDDLIAAAVMAPGAVPCGDVLLIWYGAIGVANAHAADGSAVTCNYYAHAAPRNRAEARAYENATKIARAIMLNSEKEPTMTDIDTDYTGPTGRETARMVFAHGTDDQIARFKEGVLPEHEVRKIAGDALLQPITDAGFRRNHKIHAEDVCADHQDAVAWPVMPVEMTAPQATAFRRLQQVANAIGATATPLVHRGHCTVCGRTIRRVIAQVTIVWASRKLSKEYVIWGAVHSHARTRSQLMRQISPVVEGQPF